MDSKYVINPELKCLAHPVTNHITTYNRTILQHMRTALKQEIESYVDACNYAFPAVNIFVTGSSGSFISAWLLARIDLPDIVKINVIYLKKEGEHTHYDQRREITPLMDKDFNVIIDDFISTGVTLGRIMSEVVEKGINSIDLLLVSGDVDPDYISDRIKKVICCKLALVRNIEII